MMEVIVGILALAADQLLKYWSVAVLSTLPGGSKAVIEGVFYLHYAENYGDNVSFIRGRSIFMTLIRLAQLALVLYLLLAKRKKLAPVTRGALALFLAGMLGNQLNYLFMNYVPDMFYFPKLGAIVSNLADVWVMAAMVVLFVRLAFFEGRDLMDWLEKKLTKKKAASEGELPGEPEDQVDLKSAEPAKESSGEGECSLENSKKPAEPNAPEGLKNEESGQLPPEEARGDAQESGAAASSEKS